MSEQQRASLKDLLNYEAESYFSPEEVSLIQSTFKDPRTIKILRKALLPSVGDLDLPVEEIGNDSWLTGRDYGAMPNEEIKSIVLARQDAIKFVMGGIIKLKVIANSKKETEMEAALRRSQDSNQ